MAAKNEDNPEVDENPYRSPNISALAAAKLSDRIGRRSSTGCLVLFLIALPLLDTFGMLMSLAGPFGPAMLILGLAGFICGAALGAYVSVKIKRQPWWASCRWAIYGVLGMCLPPIVIFAVLGRWR